VRYENTFCCRGERYFSFISSFFKRNSHNVFFVKISSMSAFIALFLFTFIGSFINDLNRFIVPDFVIAIILLIINVIPLSEHNIINNEMLVIRNGFFQKKGEIKISEISKMDFTTDVNPIANTLLQLHTTNGEVYKLNNQIENIDMFLNILKSKNENIVISGNLKIGFWGQVVQNLFAFVTIFQLLKQSANVFGKW
jgi:hypothetical protein